MTKITGGKIINRESSAKADRVSEPMGLAPNFAEIAANMVNAHHEAAQSKKAIEADYIARLAGAESPLFGIIRTQAELCPGITEAQYDEHIGPIAKQRYTALGYKDVSTRASILKVAFIAFAHGVTPSKDVSSNLQSFVNKEAREALKGQGILKAGKAKGGRPEGSTSDKVKSARSEAALCLAQTGGIDAETVKARVHCLLTLTTAGNWKLLDRVLVEAMRTLNK